MLNISAMVNSLPPVLIAQAGDAAEATREAAQATGAPGWIIFAVFLAIVLVPFLLGWAIAKALRLPDTRTRIGVVILAMVIGFMPFVWSVVVGTTQQGLTVAESLRESIRLGVDLAGGTNLVYEVQESSEKPLTSQILDNMVGSIVQRINPSGTEEVTVRVVGRNRIEVIVPGADPEKVRQIKRRVTKLGSLQFDLLANTIDHRQWITEAQELPGTERNVRQGGRIVASWRNVARDTDGDWKIENAEAIRYIGPDGEVLPAAPDAQAKGVVKQVLVILDAPDERVTGEYVRNASVSTDENGRPAVAFTFNSTGAQLFLRLTGSNLPNEASGFHRRLAIVLDGEVHSAPSINSPIGANGQITGDFTRAEVRELVDVLNAGALEVPLNPEPVSEFTISPLLGEDTIRKAISAILWSGLAVLLITAGYYLLAGLIADFCLMLNLVLLLGIMSLIDATFTLPGLAGVVLTFGMAVDANVLIFERMREEITRGSSLRMAIQNGFDRALSAIVDSNVTTLITAVILYLIGTDAVRGFAVSLFIGIVVSMFTALYVARLLFDIIERKRWVRTIRMNAVLTNPQVNWLKHKGAIVGASLLVLLFGVAMLVYRGPKMLDIDFLGGSMVTFQLDEPSTTTEVRDLLNDVPQFEGNVSVERLVLMGEEDTEHGRRFRVRTTLLDTSLEASGPGNSETGEEGASQEAGGPQQVTDVTQLVGQALSAGGLEIRRVTIDVGSVEPIVEANADEAFAGGYSAEIVLNEPAEGEQQQEFGTETVQALLIEQLYAIEAGGEQKYQEISELVQAVGLAGTGLEAAENEAKTFSRFRVDVAPAIDRADFEQSLQSLETQLANEPVFDEVNSFDSSVAGDTQRAAIMAILISWVAMIGFLWIRFQDISYGLAAVLGLIHDVTITVGLLAVASYLAGPLGITILGLEEFKINLPMVAAVLTLIGYSVNDTIVVFDRIREVRGKNPGLSESIVNTSLNQTLSRTLLTSVTTLIVSTVLYFFGGEGIHGFTFILTIGIIVGTFSSIYVSSPVLLWLVNRKRPRGAATKPVREAVTT